MSQWSRRVAGRAGYGRARWRWSLLMAVTLAGFICGLVVGRTYATVLFAMLFVSACASWLKSGSE